MNNAKARAAAARANRKLPPDETLQKLYYEDGLTQTEIAGHYGTTNDTVSNHFRKMGWPTRRGTAEIKPPPKLIETAQKIIRWRTALSPGRDNHVIAIAISLPRIPTLHGAFAASSPSNFIGQGA